MISTVRYIPKYEWVYFNVRYVTVFIPELKTYTCLVYDRKWNEEGTVCISDSFSCILHYIGPEDLNDIACFIKKEDHQLILSLDYIAIEDELKFSRKDAMREFALELRHKKIRKIINR